MFTPMVPLPAAEPPYEAAVAAPAAATVQPEYVYLLRVVVATPEVRPSAKIPMVLLPAAALEHDVAVDDPPTVTTSPE